MSKIDKIISRTQAKIADGQFYEAHQAVRTIAARYNRSKSYDSTIEVLYTTAQLLLKANQVGSGSDLTQYLISTYTEASVPVDATSRARLVQLLRLYKSDEPTLKAIAQDINTWSSNFGPIPYGDPELHHIIGTKFAEAGEAYEAEKNLLLGTAESPKILANLLFEWYLEDDDASFAPLYLSRGVLGYLCVQNIRDSRAVTKEFLQLLIESKGSSLAYSRVPEVNDDSTHILVFPHMPLLNFLQLLTPTCQKQNPQMYQRLKSRYASNLDSIPALNAPLETIANQYFGIAPRRQGNMLQDLMGSLFSAPQ